MSAIDGLWKPIEPDWLLEGMYEEGHFIRSLRTEDDMSTAIVTHEAVNTDTGEIIPLPVKYDAKQYLRSLDFTQQQQLSAAYDAAVSALIGPNDVQQEAGRTFKKKSAWRKLARHFGISTRVMHRERGMLGDEFVASMTVRAIAPWGQYAESEGACCTDEEVGRRQITVADAIATAETRATNRAISNLIAMGEVSADEISEGRQRQRTTGNSAPQSSGGGKAPEDKVMPFGRQKGKRLGDVESADLTSTLEWCREKDAVKWKDLIATLEQVLDNRNNTDSGSIEDHGAAEDAGWPNG